MSSKLCVESVLPGSGLLTVKLLSREGSPLQIMTRDTWVLQTCPDTQSWNQSSREINQDIIRPDCRHTVKFLLVHTVSQSSPQ